MRLFKEHGRPLTRFHRNKNVSSGSETVTKLNPLITLSRKVGGGGGWWGKACWESGQESGKRPTRSQGFLRAPFHFLPSKRCFSQRGKPFAGKGTGIPAAGCGPRAGGRTTARSEALHGSGRPPESPGRERRSLPCPLPASARPAEKRPGCARGRRRDVHATRRRHAWRREAGPTLLTCCYQARAQPISSRRRRRPAFELGTATSCCLASTQCNAVCLSALRHKGTAILWLSWTCTKMPGALGAAVRAKYRDAFYFGTRQPKGGEGRRKRGFGISA